MIRFSRQDHIASIVFDRPQKKNALTRTMWCELRNRVNDISDMDGIRVLILSGQGGNFCAGADISEFDEVRKNTKSAKSYERDNSEAFQAIRNCAIPTIASIQGVCFGGGFGIAAACDLRYGDETARFCVPPAKLGLAYPVDAMRDIVNSIGAQRAKLMAYSAQVIDADTAQSYGFLLEVFTSREFSTQIDKLANDIATNAPMSNRATKASVNAVLSNDPKDRMRAVKVGDETFESADYVEGRAAFKERRPAIFQGR